MRIVVIAILLLSSTSAMAATFTAYTPVHVAPVVHVNPVVRVNPGIHVKPMVRPVGRAHSHQGPLPVAAYAVPQKQKCADQKSGSPECPKK